MGNHGSSFVAPHTHVDPQLWWDPYGLPLVLHGVTTAMTGNCAVTLAPCRDGDDDALLPGHRLVDSAKVEEDRREVHRDVDVDALERVGGSEVCDAAGRALLE